jgi:hypothetical protein
VWLSCWVFGLLVALTGFGIWHEHLFQQMLWLPEGARRFLLFAACYWPVALALPPRWLGGAAAIFVFGYSMWWCGPVAPLAVIFLFGSAFLLGRRLWRSADAATATLAGIAIFLFTIWIALHFAVNRPVVYVFVFGGPWLLEAANLRKHAASFRFTCQNRKESAALALLIFILMAHWLVALKPEVSSDGLSMHLALPMTVAQETKWDFDFQQKAWAVMPIGGDSLYTAAYLFGGEFAARLANFGMLLLIVGLIVSACRRWLQLWQALLTAALFVSTPVVQLVTGSLFVENVWGALAVGSILALARFWETGEASEVPLAGLLLGATLAVKIQAAVFLLPVAVLGLIACWRHKRLAAFAAGAVLITAAGAPPYLYAWAKTGNPVFPFANARFRSVYYDSTNSFADPRFDERLSWKTPYDMTFHSARYFEGQGGGTGFQYLVLLLPALLLLRKRFAWLVAASGASVILALLIILPNFRYLYPALVLVSIAIGNILVEWPVLGTFALAAITILNLYFLPASGWYHRDFAFFNHSDARAYVQQAAPVRSLIAYLNHNESGHPVALFSGDAVAGLYGKAYTNTWHSENYWRSVRNAPSPEDIAMILRALKIGTIIAPVSLDSPFSVVQSFLREWTVPVGVQMHDLGIYHLRDRDVKSEEEVQWLPPGAWDDLDHRIEYTGHWLHDRQFPKSSGQSLTYSGEVGDSFQFTFSGTGITYIFTEAENRGKALVLIDGREAARIDMYSPNIKWQTKKVFGPLGAGMHTFQVRILADKNPRSAARAVDIDAVVVK